MDYGASVSQKGYDSKNCDDRFLVYSSAFQNLKIFNVYSVSAVIPSSGSNRITINHNLGYLAPFFVIYTGSSQIGRNKSYFFTDSFGYPLDFYGNYIRQYTDRLEIDIDESFDDYAPAGTIVYFTVIQFLDDFSEISAKSINSGSSSGASSDDYGIRVSKDGYDVKECTDEQCILSSSFGSPIIHMKGSTTGDSISHSLGYILNFITFTKYSGDSFIYYDAYPSASDSIIDFSGMGSDYTKYYIILKDKLN